MKMCEENFYRHIFVFSNVTLEERTAGVELYVRMLAVEKFKIYVN